MEDEAKKPHSGDVLEALEVLDRSLSRLDDTVSMVVDRLDPIILERARLPETQKGQEPKPRSFLGNSIHSKAVMVNTQRNRLEALLEVIQL